MYDSLTGDWKWFEHDLDAVNFGDDVWLRNSHFDAEIEFL